MRNKKLVGNVVKMESLNCKTYRVKMFFDRHSKQENLLIEVLLEGYGNHKNDNIDTVRIKRVLADSEMHKLRKTRIETIKSLDDIDSISIKRIIDNMVTDCDMEVNRYLSRKLREYITIFERHLSFLSVLFSNIDFDNKIWMLDATNKLKDSESIRRKIIDIAYIDEYQRTVYIHGTRMNITMKRLELNYSHYKEVMEKKKSDDKFEAQLKRLTLGNS